MKRILALALAALCLVLTGCSGRTEPAYTPVPQKDTETEAPTSDPEGDKYMNKVYATITMQDGGVIKLELYPDLAPQSVRNFCYLARQGFYDGLTFHRIIHGFMIQGGDPQGNGQGGPGYTIKGEFASNGFENDLKHTRGVISWARRSDPYKDSAGSQFFIVQQDSPHLDGSYAAFGKVIEGIEVVDRIASVATNKAGLPNEPVVIQSITIEGPELPAPDKLN